MGWQKFLADLIIKGAQKVVTSIVSVVADGMRTARYKKIDEQLDKLEVELRHKPRITRDEAADIARSINDIRGRM